MLQLLENSYTMGNKLILQSCSYLSYQDAITGRHYQTLLLGSGLSVAYELTLA